MRGRKPKPVELATLHGNPSKIRLQKGVKTDEVDQIPSPPPVLNDDGADQWNLLVPSMMQLRMLTHHDLAQLTAYCVAWQQLLEAQREIQASKERGEGGYVIMGEKGPQRNPWFFIQSNAMDKLMKIAIEFGMTPASRTRVLQAAGALPPNPGSRKKKPATVDAPPPEDITDFLSQRPD